MEGDTSVDITAIPQFAQGFVKRMRSRPDIPANLKPSLRQSLDITRWLTVAFMEKGRVSALDLLEAAVVTSYFENQPVALEVAREMLFPKKERPSHRTGENQIKMEDKASLRDLEIGQGPPKRGGGELYGEEQNYFWSEKGSKGVGGGEGSLKAWRFRKGLTDEELKAHLKAHAKKIAGKLSIYEDPEGSILRPYEYGVDPSSVDFEESLDSIVEKGKPLDLIGYHDFLVRKRRARRALVMLLDISGSMSGEPLELLKPCCAALLYCFKMDQVGIAFFESDAYILKEIRKKANREDLVDEIMSGTPSGGTMSSSVLKWSYQQLAGASAEEKFCLIFSDLCFFDLDASLRDLRLVRSGGAKVCAVTPSSASWKVEMEKNSRLFREKGCRVLKIESLEGFVGSVIKVLK
jgi:hypothetical protein